LFCSVSDLQTRFVSTSTSYYVVDDFYNNVANDDIRFLLLLPYSLSVFFYIIRYMILLFSNFISCLFIFYFNTYNN
jgi:hypothetical protein